MGITSDPRAIEGTPSENDSVTIKPKTAADQMFNSLSNATLCSKASIPTATPIAMRAFMSTSEPSGNCQTFLRAKLSICPSVGLGTGHHMIAVMIVIIKRAIKVYCIRRFLDIAPVMCGADLTTNSLVDSLLIFY